MFATEYNGKEYIFYEDRVTVNGIPIPYREMTNITHRSGDSPAFLFDYKGRRFALPYHPGQIRSILPYFVWAQKVSGAAAAGTTAASGTAPAANEPAAAASGLAPAGEATTVAAGEPAAVASEPTVEQVYAEPVIEPTYVEQSAAPAEPTYVEPARVAEPAYSEPAVEQVYAEPVTEPAYVEQPAAPVEPTYVEPAVEQVYAEPLTEPTYAEPAADQVYAERATEPDFADSEIEDSDFADSTIEAPTFADSTFEDPAFADSTIEDSAFAGSTIEDPAFAGSGIAEPAPKRGLPAKTLVIIGIVAVVVIAAVVFFVLRDKPEEVATEPDATEEVVDEAAEALPSKEDSTEATKGFTVTDADGTMDVVLKKAYVGDDALSKLEEMGEDKANYTEDEDPGYKIVLYEYEVTVKDGMLIGDPITGEMYMSDRKTEFDDWWSYDFYENADKDIATGEVEMNAGETGTLYCAYAMPQDLTDYYELVYKDVDESTMWVHYVLK